MVENSCGVSVISFVSFDLALVSCPVLKKYVLRILKDRKKDEFMALG